MLELFGHPFSSYTWKALIALYANDTPFAYRMLDQDHPDHGAFVQGASPLGKFPVLRDGEHVVFEATSIIEYLDVVRPGPNRFVPDDRAPALPVRMMDRVFDNYVMAPMQAIVSAHLSAPGSPDPAAVSGGRERLRRSYAWLERWLTEWTGARSITLIECAAAPALFYADWVEPIGPDCPRLRNWRAELNALAPVARCIDEARPYRSYFPPGAPDRD